MNLILIIFNFHFYLKILIYVYFYIKMYSLINQRIYYFFSPINFHSKIFLYSTNKLIHESNINSLIQNKILLEEENTKLKQKIKYLKELYINKVNEFNNFQKIQELENIKMKESILIKIIKEFCVIKDNFTELIKIISSKETGIKDNDNIVQNIFNGIKLMNNNLEKIFIKNNIKEFIPEINSIFDPKTQEAIYKYEDKTKKDNSIGKVFSPGYKINNKIFRHAKVAVIKNQERKLI